MSNVSEPELSMIVIVMSRE